MSQPRRTRGGGVENYSDQLCENCEPVIKSGSTSIINQGTYKSDAASKEQKENLENLSDDRRVLLAITVEIEDGCVEHIQLKEGDSAEAVAMKFCRDHALPEQFVAPLTEHIVSNIISISKEDSDIVFHSEEEHMPYDENSAVIGGAPYSPVLHGSDVVDSFPKPRDYGSGPVTAESSAVMARREHRNSDGPLMASQKINREQVCPGQGERKARKKTRRKKGRKKVSQRLLAPTITSLAKCGAIEREKPISPHPRPPSEPMKAVYMRLYTEYTRHEHRSRDEMKRSKAMYQENVVRKRMGLSKISWRLTRMRGETAKQYKNYGELLYAEGLTMKANHMKAVSVKKKQDEARELAEVTLKPKISKRAKNMKRAEGPVWDRLQNEDKPKQDLLQELRQEVWEAKLMECTFKPRINQNRKYDDQPDPYSDEYCNRFEQLFLDAESRRRRRAEYMEWFPEGVTFQPSINRYFPFRASMVQEDWQLERSVFCRLLDNATKLMEKKQLLEQMAHRQIDPRTGRALFTPVTGRKPLKIRNPVHLPIGEYLYRMKFAFDSKIKNLSARDFQIKREIAQCRYVNSTSQKLLQRLQERGFRQIFDCLDEDQDGFVDLTTANFDRLNNDVVDDLIRVMKNMEELGRDEEGEGGETCERGDGKKLDFEKFVKLMLAAESKYHIRHQVHLGLKHKLHHGQTSFTFQSEMDRQSRNLAAKRRTYSTHHQWFNIIIDELARRQLKVEEWRKERQEQEMAKCTFKPELCIYKVKKAGGEELKGVGGGDIGGRISNIIEKVQQEVHGFYFQDERGGPELLGMPAPTSAQATPRASPGATPQLASTRAYQIGSTRASTPSLRTFQTKGTSVSIYTSGRRGRSASKDMISELDDLPKEKTGMFFGLMGA